MFKTIGAVAFTSLMLFGCANTTTITQPQVFAQYPTVSELNQKIIEAKNQHWDLLSPTNIGAAIDKYEESYNSASKQIVGSDQIAQQGVAAIDRAKKQVGVAQYELRDVLTARDRVIKASMASTQSKDFVEADDDLRDLAKKLEEGKLASVRADRGDLKQRYSVLELQALKNDTVLEASKALAAAKKSNVDRYAPITIKVAEEELALAKKVIETDREAKVKSREHAQQSIWSVNRAIHIAEMITEFKQSDLSDEGVLLWYQDQLATALGESAIPDFSLKNAVMVTQVAAQLKNQSTDMATQLSNKTSQIEELESITAGQKSKLGNEEEVKAKFAQVQKMFDPVEAEVYRQGNNVLIRTYGFTFPSGSSEIQSTNFPLLNKIVKSIALFKGSMIEVSGHTDNRGTDAINEKLSEERATNVAGFLVSLGEIGSDRVSSKGFGKNKPIAPNDTVEGRASNRRVEILIKNN